MRCCEQLPACGTASHNGEQLPACGTAPHDCEQLPACDTPPHDGEQLPTCGTAPHNGEQPPGLAVLHPKTMSTRKVPARSRRRGYSHAVLRPMTASTHKGLPSRRSGYPHPPTLTSSRSVPSERYPSGSASLRRRCGPRRRTPSRAHRQCHGPAP